MSDGWAESADAWVASQGDEDDFGRRWVMDAPMLERVRRMAAIRCDRRTMTGHRGS